LFNDCI
jgi:hypothetical protein